MRRLQLAMALGLTFATFAVAAEQELTKDQIKEFLLKAKVVRSRQTSKGITQPFRLTLTDGTITHEAVFQAIDQHKTTMQFADGHVEINFVDSYKYNLAAYVLAEMLGIDDLIPIHVERKWNGNMGSLSWLVPVQMDEEDRMKRKVNAPDVDAWNKQMYKVRVFDELVFDTDANLTNVLVGEAWKLWRVDFSRAFRLNKDVKSTANLTHCDRKLFESLKALNSKEFREKMKPYLTGAEIDGVLARRDKIVSFIQKSIAEKGENEVLY
jgi:hypothetical protein